MTYEELKAEVQGSAMVVAAVGEELTGDMRAFYEKLAELLDKRNYYVVTLLDRKGLEEAGILPDRITAPADEAESDDTWEKYLRWFSFTMNQKLCILELGVGFKYPAVIRFPMEKTCYFNQKSKYIRINERFPQLSEEIKDRGISVVQDPVDVFLK